MLYATDLNFIQYLVQMYVGLSNIIKHIEQLLAYNHYKSCLFLIYLIASTWNMSNKSTHLRPIHSAPVQIPGRWQPSSQPLHCLTMPFGLPLSTFLFHSKVNIITTIQIGRWKKVVKGTIICQSNLCTFPLLNSFFFIKIHNYNNTIKPLTLYSLLRLTTILIKGRNSH